MNVAYRGRSARLWGHASSPEKAVNGREPSPSTGCLLGHLKWWSSAKDLRGHFTLQKIYFPHPCVNFCEQGLLHFRMTLNN